MFDWDAVIVGGGPAGLTAGLYLARAKYRALLLDKDSFGGYPKNVALIENYPGFPEGIAGAELASAMVAQAAAFGLQYKLAEVNSLELFDNCRWVGFTGGRGYTTAVVILAGGSCMKKLNVPGEDAFQDKGVFTCALCDGSRFTGQAVAVCGGGDAAVSEALYMARLASQVFLIHRRRELRAAQVLQDRLASEPKIEFVPDSVVTAVAGGVRVERVRVRNNADNTEVDLPVSGVLVHIGVVPNTGYLNGIVPLDNDGQVIVNSDMETEIPFVLAAGDIRHGSPRQIAAAVGDGVAAGITAQRLLQQIG